MKANELINMLEERGYLVDTELYLREYNATIHTVNIEGQLISIEYTWGEVFHDEISDDACKMLFDIIDTGIKKNKYLVCDEALKGGSGETFERKFSIWQWGANAVNLFSLYNRYCDSDAFYCINNIDAPDALDYEEFGYLISTCPDTDCSIVLSQLRMNGIKIPESNSIKDMRIYRNITQKELSKATGIGQSRISDLEKLSDFSNITIGSMKAIAEVLNCKVDDLI